MANFMEGFMRGYDFVDGHKRLTRQEERLEQDRERNNVLQGRQDDLWQRQQQGFADQDKLKDLNAKKYRSIILRERIAGGDTTAITEAEQWLQSDPRGAAFMQQTATPEGLNQAKQDIATIKNSFQGRVTKQEGIEAANRALKPFLNYGDGGENKRIADLFPTEDRQGVYVELEMEENGQTKRSPLTTNRSAADKELKPVPVQGFLSALNYYEQYINQQLIALGDTAPLEARAKANERTLSRQDKREQADYEHGLSMKKISEEYKLKEKLEKVKGKSGTSDKLPNEIQLIEYYVANGIAQDKKTAQAMVAKSKSDPIKIAADIAEQQIKSQQEAFLQPGDPGYLSPDDIRRQALWGVLDMYEEYYKPTDQRTLNPDGIGQRPSLEVIFK